ncbi:hypothetical protein [Moritella viscosa]|uniref:Uncharacterized protein SYNPCC7002_B0001-ORF 1-ORF943 n=1 Tax=Moritella viscosa TaxID=80854 RepID=A0A1L0A0W5_9GAMM|nr:hypothetical protein [Moritella viscosa]SGZ03521.1 Uncharacterized protein SYNPCC7002_B0001-ORF 1-ORF943 [Moritella viscosa]SGZ19647.1 Uncharacterized protein SYNPCC7002_B0001-ORF 1-ORF943 [Moritella viscosa]
MSSNLEKLKAQRDMSEYEREQLRHTKSISNKLTVVVLIMAVVGLAIGYIYFK